MTSVVYKSSGRALPVSFSESVDWMSLNEIQQQNFCARLCYVDEIVTKSSKWLHSLDHFEDSADFLDEVEQDLFINLSAGDADQEISPWLINTSWTFDLSPERMLKVLPRAIVTGLSETGIGFECNEEEFRTWLEVRVENLRLLLSGFYNSNTYVDAVAHLVGMNLSLCACLLGVSKQRLNKTLSGTQN